ncbi:MAG TPA: hypothetical protein VKE22_08370 [Haliangiales bacterium]|nr:hypothetical protein [Haliangiales bacterium]
MTLFEVVHVVHVLAAVVGTGCAAAVAVTARGAVRSPEALASSSFAPLLRWATRGIGTAFLAGVALDLVSGGAFHDRWWFRLAALSTIAASILLWVIYRRVRRVASGQGSPDTLTSAPSLAWVALAILTVVVVLMDVRPF